MSEVLDGLRSETDALAATYVPARQGAAGRLHGVVRGGDVASRQSDYINDTSEPTRQEFDRLIDRVKVRHAQRFFATYGLQIGAALVYKALPDSYAAARGAQVLYLTGELVSSPARRVRETTQFVLNVMTPPAQLAEDDKAATTLTPGQPGALAARRIRMFHQFVRNAVAGQWAERWQSKDAYFQEIAPDGPALGRAAQPGGPARDAARVHGRRVRVAERARRPVHRRRRGGLVPRVGRRGVPLGDRDRERVRRGGQPNKVAAPCKHFLRLDPGGSASTLDAIRRRHHMESYEGTILTNALLGRARSVRSSAAMKPFPASLMRYLLGDETANLLGISRGGWMQQWLLSLNGMPARHRDSGPSPQGSDRPVDDE